MVGATNVDPTLVLHQPGVTDWTTTGEIELGEPERSFVLFHTDDVRDDLAGLFDNDLVADLYILAANFDRVVKTCTTHHG